MTYQAITVMKYVLLSSSDVFLASMLVVLGGYNTEYLDSVEVIDLKGQISCNITDLPYPVGKFAAATYNDYPVFCGGETPSG